jgi:Holliday junction resolvasome RuvABC endonuclease subunit
MRILGLDPSLTNYGWALHDTEGTGRGRIVARGRFQTKPRQFPDEVGRYMYLRAELRRTIVEQQPEAMGVEHPVLGEDYSEGMYGLFLFSLEAIKDAKMDLVLFAPPQVKKYAKDILQRPKSWKMQKSDMVDAAREHAGGGNWDHNEADAYHVAALSGRFWKFHAGLLAEDALTSYEVQLFTQIKHITKGKRAGMTQMKGILYRESDRFFRWSALRTAQGT